MLCCNVILQIKSNTPVLMCSVPGFDASGRLDDLAAELGKQITSIAIGEFQAYQNVVLTLVLNRKSSYSCNSKELWLLLAITYM